MKRRRNDIRPAVKVFYVEESKERPRPTLPRTGIRTSKESTERPNLLEYPLTKTYNDYCRQSTVDGFHYLHQERDLREKLFWLILLLLSIIICISQIKVQYDRWHTAPVIISFSEAPTPVSVIPFPAITICAETKAVKTDKINFQQFYEYLKSQGDRVIEQPPWLNEDEFQQMRALLHICGNYLVENMTFPEYPPMIIEDQLLKMTPPFDNMFVHCQFNKTMGDCKPQFDRIYTKEGICYSFNALNESEIYSKETHQFKYFHKDIHIRKRKESLDWDLAGGYDEPDNYDTYPERVIGSGLRSGLVVSLHETKNNLDSVCRQPVQGFKLILHAPDVLPEVDKTFIHIPYGMDVLVVVTPHFVYTTAEIEHYSPEDRHCYYPAERVLRFFRLYAQTNCEIECLTNYTLRMCGCVHFSMPRLSNTPLCGASKITCYDKAEDDFLLSEYTGLGEDNSYRCNCLPGCYELQYNPEVSQGIFNIRKAVEALNITPLTEGTMASRLRISFKTSEFTAMKRSELYGTTDFMANCGGLFGLFIGISAISIVELIYHLTVRLYRNVE